MKSARRGLLLLTLVACARVAGSNPVPPFANGASSSTSALSIGYNTVFNFNGMDGADPVAGLIAVNGVLYGTTEGGGEYGAGTVFSLSTSGAQGVLHNFGDSQYDGARPVAALTAMQGKLYGTTINGGKPANGFACTSGCGTFFEVSAAGKVRTLYNFTPPSTVYPNTALAALNDTLYGTSYDNVYSATTSGHVSTLYGFKGYPTDGWGARGALLPVKGVLYGTTVVGGADKYGTVYSITTAGAESLLYSFKDVPDGRYPQAGLIDMKGALYGTTESGGTGSCHPKHRPRTPVILGCGTVFEINTAGAEKVIYNFQGKSDGAYPEAGLVAVNGVLYGTTSAQGAYGKGTIFRLSRSGRETVLHSFGDGADGATPLAALTDVNGTLYGTASAGGMYDNGTVFAFIPR